MGKLSADGITAQSFVNYPKDWYLAEVVSASEGSSKSTQAPMIIIDWKPTKGDAVGPTDNPGHIREWIMTGGLTEKGEKHNITRFLDRLDALKVKRDYTCCDTMDSNRPFVVKKEDGKYYCPHCGNIARINIDKNDDGTFPWNGLQARIQVSIEKREGTDEENNRINRVTPVVRP